MGRRDFVCIPAETWRQVWDFGDEPATLPDWIAPQFRPGDERGTSIPFDREVVCCKSRREEV